jgi:hypothetical protein
MNEVRSTAAWAAALGISIAEVPPRAEASSPVSAYSAREIATRALILQGVVATASGVEAQPIIEWFQSEDLWISVSPKEREFLETHREQSTIVDGLRWRQEAEWTALWVVGMVESLGLPVRCCDTRRLVDEVMPALGTAVEPFLSRAFLRTDAELLAEDDRTYNLWCNAMAERSAGARLPPDLNLSVLYQRRYVFEWLDRLEEWDDVVCDA